MSKELIPAIQAKVIEMIAMGHTPVAVMTELSLTQAEVTAIIKNPANKKEIEKQRTEVMTGLGTDREIALNMIKTILMADITEMYYPRGHKVDGTDVGNQLKPFDEIPLHLRQCITGLEFKHSEDRFGMPIVNTKVTTLDKMKAIETFARSIGMFDAQEVKAPKKIRIGFK